jgi:hypothetical protein
MFSARVSFPQARPAAELPQGLLEVAEEAPERGGETPIQAGGELPGGG